MYVSLSPSVPTGAHPARCSDPNERAHFWVADPDSATPDLLDTALTSRMYIDTSEVVRVRVEADEFYDNEPGPPKATEGVMVNGQAKEREGRRAPYTITVRFFLSRNS